MRNIILFVAIFLSSLGVQAQELNCSIFIDADQTGQPNQQVFRTLEDQLTEFVNNTKWTNKIYKNQERINCNMSIIISDYINDTFSATIQIQSSRPTYGSTYDSPVFNYFDRQFTFKYVEFQPLNYNRNAFGSNLISVIAFYVYTIIGLDANTFELNSGEEYFQEAKQIVNTAASSAFKGWRSADGTQSRYRYNDALLSAVYAEYHNAMYDYHRKGMDAMSENQKTGKAEIINAISILKGINDRRPNSFLLRTFFDAKSDEITTVFSGGPKVDIVELVENLNRIAPTMRSNWSNIKY